MSKTLNDNGRSKPSLAWGEHLASYKWDYCGVLTLRLEMSEEAFAKHFNNVFIRKLSKYAQRQISWFYSFERGGLGRLHAHVLLWAGGKLDRRSIERAWSIGRNEFEIYEASRGNTFYAAKEINYGDDFYDVSKTMPPKRFH